MWQRPLNGLAKAVCRARYRHRLSAFLDNQLDVESAKTIAEHLSACSHCKGEVEQLRFASRALLQLDLLPTRNLPMRGQVLRLTSPLELSPLNRLYSLKVNVPLPLAAGLSIVFLSSISFAIFRRPQTATQSSIPPATLTSEVVKIVEVPTNRVVNRTIYLKQPRTRKRDRFTTNSDLPANVAQNTTTNQWSDNVLREFRPAASANLRVVKEREK